LASAREAVGIKDFSAKVPVSSAEAVETGLTAVEAVASSAPADFSSRTSSFFYFEVAEDDDIAVAGWP
jgi:hypothetical protein